MTQTEGAVPSGLQNTLRQRREGVRLSQQALGDRVGVSRQAIIAIEASRQVPSTSLALLLAAALRCRVEDLFYLKPAGGLQVRVAPIAPGRAHSRRVAMGSVAGQWVAHRLPMDGSIAADGVIADGASSTVEPLADTQDLKQNVLVAGCAPLLGALAQRVGRHFTDARLTWLGASSLRALDLLEAGLVHAAGIHLSDARSDAEHVAVVLSRFPGQRMLIVNLTRWRQGFVVATGNPLGICSATDLLRPGLRLARREEGAGAQKLVKRLLASEDASVPSGPFAAGHRDVATLVRCGAADVGIAIESVALEAGLDFIPLAEERFDLIVPEGFAAQAPVARLIDTIDDRGFRGDVSHLSGYDGGLSGHVTSVP